MEAPDSEGALIAAGLNWNVIQEPIFTGGNEPIRGYKANIRDYDRRVLGVVTDRYKVIQKGVYERGQFLVIGAALP